MGTSTTGAQFAAKLDRFAKDLNDPRVGLNAAGLAGKRIFEASAVGAGALGVKPKGKRKLIGARYDFVKGAPGGGAIIVTYTGPAHLINNPIAPHFIAPSGFGSRSTLAKAGQGIGAVTAFGGTGRGQLTGLSRRGRRNKGGKRALTIGDNVRAYAFHPGTGGKSFFQRAEGLCVTRLPNVYAKSAITAPLSRIF